jgi:hypothetical protein
MCAVYKTNIGLKIQYNFILRLVVNNFSFKVIQ